VLGGDGLECTAGLALDLRVVLMAPQHRSQRLGTAELGDQDLAVPVRQAVAGAQKPKRATSSSLQLCILEVVGDGLGHQLQATTLRDPGPLLRPQRQRPHRYGRLRRHLLPQGKKADDLRHGVPVIGSQALEEPGGVFDRLVLGAFVEELLRHAEMP